MVVDNGSGGAVGGGGPWVVGGCGGDGWRWWWTVVVLGDDVNPLQILEDLESGLSKSAPKKARIDIF